MTGPATCAPGSPGHVSPTPPISPIPPTGDVSPEEFRAVMRHFPTGVTVVTTTGPEGPHGMTANAVMSVSLASPTLLVAVHHSARTHAIVSCATGFTVNVLAADQEEHAALFACGCPEEDPFRHVPWERSAVTGDPVLTGSLATLDCRLEQRIDVADHTLVIGSVASTRVLRPDAAPMVFARRGYWTLAAS